MSVTPGTPAWCSCGSYPWCPCGGWQQPQPIQPHFYPQMPVQPLQVQPKGCICPPGSEKTCQRSDCGRRDGIATTTTTTRTS